jgi:Transposase DDE domain
MISSGSSVAARKLSNEDWTSKIDPDAKIAKMKDGSTHVVYKPEHAVDLDTGIIMAAPIRAADERDTTTLGPTLEMAEKNLSAVGVAPTPEDPCDLVADKGSIRATCSKTKTAAHGGRGSLSPGQARDIYVGMATVRRAQRSSEPQPVEIGRRQGGESAARGSSAASLMFSSAAACAAHGFAHSSRSRSARRTAS